MKLEKETWIGKGGYFNSLSQSILKIDKVVINQGITDVYLIGEISLGGSCDDPRFPAQISETVKQFSFVRHVNLFFDGKPLNFSQK